MTTTGEKRHAVLRDIKRRPMLHMFIWLGLAYLIVFNIIPMTGAQIAFRDFKLKHGFIGIFSDEWVGLKYFKQFINDRKFIILLRNTLAISCMKLLVNFPMAIIFAVSMSEMPWPRFKRVVQTVSYLPHFISWVVVAGFLGAFFSTSQGLVPEVMRKFGVEMPGILMEADYYYPLAVFSELWKEMGWNAIIYLAAITGIDPSLYESAKIDGAGRLKRIWHITLPGIKGTIAVLLIMGIGGLMGSANMEQSMLLGNATNISRSEIIELHVYNQGLTGGRYSYSAAAGLFQSVISVILVLSANLFHKKVLGESLF